MQPTPRSHRPTAVWLVVAIFASILSLGASAAVAPAAGADPAPTVTGQPCAPGIGVTVVVDYQHLGQLEVGCAPGQQADGFAALANAGFSINEDPGALAGTVCQIEGLPTAGFPACWYDGFWGYWKSDGAQAWSWSNVGAAHGPLAVDRVEGWSWTSPVPADYSGAPMRIAVDGLADLLVGDPDCAETVQVPTFDIVDDREVLPVALADGHPVEVAVLTDPTADPTTATWTEQDTVSLTGLSGETRILARRAGTECSNAPTFDATYDVRAAYAPRWNGTGAGSPSPALDKASTSFVGWATGHSEYTPGGNVNASFQTPTNAYGPITSSLVVLGDRGSITLTFDTPITDGPGYDFAPFENGFASGALDFLEVAYVEVSSNGTDFVRFDSASRRATPVGSFTVQDPAELGGLAGKDLAGKGTPFDLSVLKSKPDVRSGAVDLNRITHVRLKDIQGDGGDLDSFGRPIYDPNPVTGSAGYDLTGIGVINALDEAAPVVGITSAPTGTVAATDAEIAFTVDDDTATVERQLDGGSWTAATSPFTLTDLTSGPHTVTVRATDPSGNVGTDSATWTVDTVAPVVEITAAPTGAVQSRDATIEFSVDDAEATTQYRLDGGSWAAATSPIVLEGLAYGSRTVEVRAVDAVENVGSNSATWTVQRDARPVDEAALDWLERELEAGGHGVPGFVPGAFDWGLTADAVLALAAGDRSAGAETVATTENLLDHVSDYGTWDDFGPDYPGVRVAGALAKLNLVAEVQGIDDPADTDGFDLEAEVRATMETTGPQAGRFSDVDPHFGSNNANGFGQALAMIGLSYSDDGVPAQAVSFLLEQQCPGGGFRLTYSGTAGCETAAAADTDNTAIALQALLVVDRTPAVHRALIEGLAWLEAKQDANGGWGGTGPTASLNTNSSGLIAQALAAAGRAEAAGDGADWITAAALTNDNTGSGPGAVDVGAIAYTYGSRDTAIANGIDPGGRDQWRRATAQAVLGLGLPDYGSINRDPAEPVADLRISAESFVTAAYRDFLGRPPTAGELATQVPKVGTTVSSRASVVKGLAESDEWIGKIVVGFYEDTLGRGPDPSGRAFWINQLRTGRRTVAQAAAEFYASNEYFRNRGGNTVETWVTDLYDRLLHRAPDPSGKAFWVSRTTSRGRVHVAGQMYQSAESRRDRVSRLYVELLGRQPDPSGRDYWARRILTQGDIALAANLASSNEYLHRSVARFP